MKINFINNNNELFDFIFLRLRWIGIIIAASDNYI